MNRRNMIFGGVASALLGGCGGGDSAIEEIPDAVKTVNYYADSIFAAQQLSLSTLLQSKGVRLGSVGNSIVASTTSFWLIAATNSNGKIIPEYSKAFGGATTSSLLTQISGLNSTCNAVLIMEGTNDAAQSVSLQSHITNLRRAIQAVQANGWLPILMAAAPNDRPFSDVVNRMAIAERFLAEAEGVPFFDPWARLIDVDGTWIAGASADQVHPLPYAERIVGNDLWSEISTGTSGYLLPRSNVGKGLFGISGNALQFLDSNNDGLPNGWLTSSLVTPSFRLLPTSYPFRGNKCLVTMNQSVTGYIYRRTFDASGVTPGDLVRLTGFLSLEASFNMRVRVFLRFNGPLIDLNCAVLIGDTSDNFFSAEMQVPAEVTNIGVFIQCTSQIPGNFSGIVGFGGMEIYNVTKNIF